MLYTENAKESTKHVLEPLNEFSEVPGYKINIQKAFIFPYTCNEQSKKGK